jgi:hypothetical protein
MTDHHLPARRQALPIFIGFLVSAALAVAGVRCSSPDAVSPPADSHVEHSQGAELAPPTTPIAAEPAPARSAAATEPAPAAEPSDPGGTTIGRLMEVTDANDRTLLADIERKAGQPPDKTVYQLLELRRAGKPRAELERFIQSELQGGIAVRMSAMKWLRKVHGEPEPAPSNEPLLRGPGDPDPQPRTVKPLTKASP